MMVSLLGGFLVVQSIAVCGSLGYTFFIVGKIKKF